MSGFMVTNLGAVVVLRHRADVIMAKDGNGLQLQDDGGNLGIFIEDGGQVGVGPGATAPDVELMIASSDAHPICKVESASANSYPAFALKNDTQQWAMYCDGTAGDAWALYDLVNSRYAVSAVPAAGQSLVMIGQTPASGNANMTVGLTINQGASDDEILTFKSSDIAHGITGITETDTYAYFAKSSATLGGLRIISLAETGQDYALLIRALATDAQTSKSSAHYGPIILDGAKKSGTSWAAMGANENVVSMATLGTTLWILDADGDTWQSGSIYTEAHVILETNNTEIQFEEVGGTKRRFARMNTSDQFEVGGTSQQLCLLSHSGSGVLVNTTTDNANASYGLTIQQAGWDDEILAFKSSDVAHGVTTWAETDTYAMFKKANATVGGLAMWSFAETTQALRVYGIVTTADTTKSSSADAPIQFECALKDGTSYTDMTANANLVAIKYGSGSNDVCWLVDKEGDTWQSGSILLNATKDLVLNWDSTADTYISESAAGKISIACSGLTCMYVRKGPSGDNLAEASIGTTPSTGRTLNLYQESDDITSYIIYGINKPTHTVSGTYYNIGIFSQANSYNPLGVDNSGYLYGTYTQSFHRGGGDLNLLIGQHIQYGTYTGGSGDVTDSRGINIQPFCYAGTTVNLRSIYITETTFSGGTATSEYAIFSAQTAPSRLTGTLEIITASLYVGDTFDSNTNMSQGVTIRQGSYDDEILAFKSGDVAHGLTGITETDTFAMLTKASGPAGGLALSGVRESSFNALQLMGLLAANVNTTKSSAGRALVEILGSQGAAGTYADVVANGNVLAVRARKSSAFSTVFLVDEDGDTWQSGGFTVNANSIIYGTLLYIEGSGSPYVELRDTTNTVRSFLRALDTSGWVGTYSNHSFTIRTNNTNAITVDTSQNVSFAGNVSLAPAEILYLDGGSNTYLYEDAADSVRLVVGGSTAIHCDNTKVELSTGGSERVQIDSVGISLADSHSVHFDSAPSSDHNASGHITTKTAGENLVFGEVCYFKSDGKLWKCDADAAASVVGLYMALESISADATGKFLKQGWVRDDSWAWTVGGRLYCSTTAGDLTQTAPSGSGDAVVCVGWAEGADYVAFFPDCTIVEVS